MPDKYMREIEEILRNIERTEPQHDLGERIRPFTRPRSAARRPRVSFSPPQLGIPVTMILLGIALALVASGLAYYQVGASLVSGVIALVAFAFFVAGVALGWWARFRGVGVRLPARSLRRPPTAEKVVRMRPARSNPVSSMATRLRMWRMRRRYRNFPDH